MARHQKLKSVGISKAATARASLTTLASATVAIALVHGAQAQVTDPGSVYESVQPKQLPLLTPTQPSLNIQRAPNVSAFPDLGTQIPVSSFRFVGVKQFTPEQLLQRLQPLTNRSLTVAQINSAADVVMDAYREAGFLLAQAAVLPQAIEAGVITITVNEGKLQKIEFSSAQDQAVPSVLRSGISASIQSGDAVNTKRLEESLLLANDLPGRGVSNAQIALDTSPQEGIGININYSPAPRVQGLVSFDNSGNRFTGKERVLGQVSWNEPLSAGDQAALTLLNTGKHLNYAQIGYRFPLNLRTTIGASVSALHYELCCLSTPGVSKGSVVAAGVDASYNLRMERRSKLFLTAGLDTKALDSQFNGVDQTDRRVSALSVGMRGTSETEGGALRGWTLSVRTGRTSLSHAAEIAADAAGARIQGNFSKLSGTWYQSQAIRGGWSWLGQLRGQGSLGRNLEGSEKFVLGGPDGVRAYPSGEASGDHGWLANLEVRYAFTSMPGLSIAGFADLGGISRYSKNASAILSTQPNSYELSGIGLGVRYTGSQATLVFSVAEPLGNNKGKDSLGRNSEGRKDGRTQAWLQAVWRL